MTEYLRLRSGVVAAAALCFFFAAVVAVMLVGSVVDTVVSMSRWGSLPGHNLVVAAVTAPIVAILSVVGFGELALLRSWRRTDMSPIRARATLLDSRRSNTRINHVYLETFRLRVDDPQGAYEVESRWPFPRTLRDRVRRGASLPVRIDPADHRRVLIDWDRARLELGVDSDD